MMVLFNRADGTTSMEIVVPHDTLPVSISCDLVMVADRWRGANLVLHWEPGHKLSQSHQEVVDACPIREGKRCEVDLISTHQCEEVLEVVNTLRVPMQDVVPILKHIMASEVEQREHHKEYIESLKQREDSLCGTCGEEQTHCNSMCMGSCACSPCTCAEDGEE